jgi:hypothetical protein
MRTCVSECVYMCVCYGYRERERGKYNERENESSHLVYIQCTQVTKKLGDNGGVK